MCILVRRAESMVKTAPACAILSIGQYKYLGAAAQTIEPVKILPVVIDRNAQSVEKHADHLAGDGGEGARGKLAERYKVIAPLYPSPGLGRFT